MSDATDLFTPEIEQEAEMPAAGKTVAMRDDKQVTHVQEGQVVRADTGSVLEIISRVASDPNIDVSRLMSLMDLHERIAARGADQQFSDAMNACQGEMEMVRKDAHNPSTKSKYATYAALDRALRPIYTKHGFSVSFDTDDCPLADHIRVVAKVSHNGGHKERPHLDMPADGKGAKGGDVMTKTHAIGAAVTYGKRYLLGMVFNIAVGEDDDGNSNGGREPSKAVQKVIAAINACETPAELVLWKKNQAKAAQDTVADDEWRDVIALWNRRAASMKKDSDHG